MLAGEKIRGTGTNEETLHGIFQGDTIIERTFREFELQLDKGALRLQTAGTLTCPSTMEAFWKNYKIPEGETLHWQLGPLELWVRRLPGEWQVASRSDDDNSLDDRWVLGDSATFPTDLPFKRFAFDSEGEDDLLTLRPSLPDRSVVSRPAISLEVPPGAKASFFCGVPLWVEILAGTLEKPMALMKIPTRPMSRTFFGTAQEGEPCYASTTRAMRSYQQLPPYGFRVLCPVNIHNQTNQGLPVERICIRVKHLRIFQGAEYLWTNEIRVTKSNPNEASKVTFSPKAPSFEPDAEMITKPQEKPTPGGILLRTFTNLWDLIDI